METTNINPAKYLGFGTWVLWGQGRVPVGVNTNDGSFNTVEKTGGEKSHKLTIKQLPKHSFNIEDSLGVKTDLAWGYSGGSNTNKIGTTGENSMNRSLRTNSIGNDEPHNNLQPYITCYMWKRTA